MLTDRQIAVLQMEQRRYRFAGAKWVAVRTELDMTPIAYGQELNRMLDDPDALLFAPVVVRRLQRIREQRTNRKRAS